MSNVKTPKIDRRVARTRKALKDALFSLILEGGYDAVTIEEITSRADVGRTTFYLHYKDKEDLLMESIGELVDELVHALAHLPLQRLPIQEGNPPESGMLSVSALALPFEHVARNADLYRVILRGEGTYSTTRRMREMIISAIEAILEAIATREKLVFQPLVPKPVLLNSITGAFMGLVSWWLESDMPYSPDQLAWMYQQMLMKDLPEMLGGKLD